MNEPQGREGNWHYIIDKGFTLQIYKELQIMWNRQEK